VEATFSYRYQANKILSETLHFTDL